MLTYKFRKNLKKVFQNVFKTVSGDDKKKSAYQLNYNMPAFNRIPQDRTKFHENIGNYGDLRHLKSMKLYYLRSWNDTSKRYYSTSKNDNFPQLTDFVVKSYPGPFTDIQNLLITHLSIRQQLDSTFSTSEFLATTKKVCLNLLK